jgi:hypothetical protein
MYAPKGTPKEVVGHQQGTERGHQGRERQKAHRRTQLRPGLARKQPPLKACASTKAEVARWDKVIKAAGVTAE